MKWQRMLMASLAIACLLTGCPDDDENGGVNVSPVATDDIAITDQANQPTAVLIEVLENDRDDDGTLDPATVTVVTQPPSGIAVVDATTGTIAYTPESNVFGIITFTYTVNDDEGATSNAATVTVIVNAVPVAFMDFVERLLAIPEEMANTLDPEPLETVVFADQIDDTGEPTPLP